MPGPFVRTLEYATEVEAEVLGKPAPAFFAEEVVSMGPGLAMGS